jgi:hypothetical protein
MWGVIIWNMIVENITMRREQVMKDMKVPTIMNKAIMATWGMTIMEIWWQSSATNSSSY